MSRTVTITDLVTKETRSFQDDSEWHEASALLWSDGNFGCDCNRGLFFAEAAGEPDPDRECGDDRYHVTISENGRVLYQDDEPSAAALAQGGHHDA